ncbi:MAG: type VI immunity family protein [Pseudomonadota bacterium]
MPDYIFFGEDPIAQPAFRILAYWPVALQDPVMSQGLVAIFDSFLQHHRDALAYTVVADEKRPMEGREASDAGFADMRDWLATAAKEWPATARTFGPISEETGQIVVPSFRVEQMADLSIMDISVPADPETAVKLADQVTELLKSMPTLYAVMGMGFFLPTSLEDLKDHFPRGSVRYKTAIEFMAEGPRWCLREDIGNTFWDEMPEETDGIPDISWRTMVGAHYLPRLGQVAIDAEGVTVDQSDAMLVVTAGATPIWGDVNTGEDISAYRAVADALAPARASVRPMLNGLFGAQVDNPDGADRVEAWYERFEA